MPLGEEKSRINLGRSTARVEMCVSRYLNGRDYPPTKKLNPSLIIHRRPTKTGRLQEIMSSGRQLKMLGLGQERSGYERQTSIGNRPT
jgi:hypothetical protein